MQRILIVSHYYPPHVGGIEIVAYNEATRHAALGHQVTVVTSKTQGDPASGLYEGVRVVRVPAFNGLQSKGIPFPIFSPILFFRLWRETRRADIVHIHDVFYISSFCAALVAQIHRRPTVITQHVAMVSHPSRATTMIERLVYLTSGKWVLRRSARVITINTRVQQFLVDLGVDPQKLVSMNNGVNMSIFHKPTAKERASARKVFALPVNAFVVLFVGRFVSKKGFDVMLQAGDPGYLTVFAGGETEVKPEHHQRFFGQMAQAELAQLYRAADLFVLPSDSEGFPLTAQEAMASQVPVVLKYDPGYKRYNLTVDQMVFLKQAKPTALKRLIMSLQNDTDRRQAMAKAAFRYAQENFSWDKHVLSLDELYTTVLSEDTVRA